MSHTPSFPTRALVLAAGVGRRLRPHTLTRPKGLIDVEGMALLRHQLVALADAGVRDVVMVTGYRQQMLREAVESWGIGFGSVTWVDNPDYSTTNTLTSVHLGAQHIKGESFLLSNGDVWLARGALNALQMPAQGAALVVDASVTLDEEAMKVRLDERAQVVSISKTMPVHSAYAESIGVYMFDAPCGAHFLGQVAQMFEQGHTHLFYEAALADALEQGLMMRPMHIATQDWTEVDDAQDLRRARACAARKAQARLREWAKA